MRVWRHGNSAAARRSCGAKEEGTLGVAHCVLHALPFRAFALAAYAKRTLPYVTLAGLELAIFGSEDQRLIH